jgi:hypothetical protein
MRQHSVPSSLDAVMTPIRRPCRIHVRAIHMIWKSDRSSRGYHHGNLKEALIRAALELIAAKGPSGFTFAEAARSAGAAEILRRAGRRINALHQHAASRRC